MRWLMKRRHLATRIDEAEAAATARVAEAEALQQRAQEREPVVAAEHSQTSRLRNRNHWSAVVGDVIGAITPR